MPLNPVQLRIKDNKPHLLEVKWDLDAVSPHALVTVDGKQRMRIPLANESLHGLSYLHLLSDTNPGDKGYLVEWVKAEAL